MRRCTACGEHPAPPVEGVNEWRQPQTWAMPVVATQPDAVRVAKQKRQVARKRQSRANWFVVKLVCGWLLFAGLIVMAARSFWSSERTWAERKDNPDASAQEGLSNSDVDACSLVFKNYLAARSAAQRTQYVLNASSQAIVIDRYEESNSTPDIPVEGLKMIDAQAVKLKASAAILLNWQSADGKRFDTVFRRSENEWRLDWAHFVRYSETPLHGFLEGQGEAIAEFRLLARERLANERKSGPEIGVVFSEPRFGYIADGLKESPEFVLRRDTDDGRLLSEAFKAAREGRAAFGVRGEINPSEMIRVRVRLIRDGQGRCHVEKIIAAHWMSSDEPGF